MSIYESALETMYRSEIPAVLSEGETRFVNRELSWMEFNERVLEEARDKNNPLFERLNFLAITGSNLDEFFMIRVASLIDLVQAGGSKPDPAGLPPAKQLELLLKRNKRFFKKQYSTWNRQILPQLKNEGIEIIQPSELSEEQKDELESYFDQQIFPVLSPIAVDAARPFPLISSKSLNLLVIPARLPENVSQYASQEKKPKSKADAEGNSKTTAPYAIVQIPSNLPRLIPLTLEEHSPGESGEAHGFILLEDLVRLFIEKLFDNAEIQSAHTFRIMRNADFVVDEEDTSDLLSEIEDKLKLRKRGEVIRLELEHAAQAEELAILQAEMKVPEEQIFRIRGPIDLTFVSKIPGLLPPRPDLHYPPFNPQPSPAFPKDKNVFACIRERDILLHHPYESFDPVIRVISEAAEDPQVLAIKQTLYRVSSDSPIIASLARAAEAGKQVLVLVELKARFDEENNIHWARELERAGCHVLYGIRGLKTHSKITLIVREEEDGLRRYVHIGTGNYNDKTARIYTDLGIWSCSERLGEDATNFFNMISGFSLPHSWNLLVPAPRWLKADTLFRIEREKRHAENGQKAMILGKTNSLVDPEIIDALYAASQAGVLIRLVVRGICCLRPGVKGLSENIEVRSVVGRFLEHSRIFYYYNSGAEDLLIGSADWMPRNLDRRIELMMPVHDPVCRDRIFQILDLELRDTERAHICQADGLYHAVDRRGREILDSQIELSRAAIRAAEVFRERAEREEHYEPATSYDAGRH